MSSINTKGAESIFENTEISVEEIRDDIDAEEEQFEEYEEVEHKNYGNTIPIGMTADGKEKYLLGPHYYVFLITWTLSLIGIFYLLKVLYPVSNTFGFVGSVLASIIYAYTYMKIGFSPPGIASSPIMPPVNQDTIDRYCVPCKVVRDRTTKHCYYCDVCIFGYDHHCPWVGKCIGRDNLSLFYSFLCSVSVMMGLLIFTAVSAAPL